MTRAVFLCLLLAACGGGGDDTDDKAMPIAPIPYAVIGPQVRP